MNIERITFDSIYIEIYKLSEGIYASIFNQKMGSSSNAGFFDLGNITIIFDTLMDPFSTRDLIKASNSITNKTPFLLINSHFHMDHVFGNRLFSKSVPIISSYNTLERFNKELLDQFSELRDIAPAEFKKTRELLQNEKDPAKIQELKNDLETYREIQDPNFRFRPPDILLHDKLTIKGSKRSVDILNVGNAHSFGDIIAYFQNEKICFMGDLLFSELDPEWAKNTNGTGFASNPHNFKEVMITYLNKDIEFFVPGHGTLCSKKEVKNTINFLDRYFLNK